MPEDLYKISRCSCSHVKSSNKNNVLYLFESISYCLICSRFIIKGMSSFEIQEKTIKPNNIKLPLENPSNLLWNETLNNSNYTFVNKKSYLKIRSSIIKNMKNICSHFSLSLKTYFLSIQYLDKICSFSYSFEKNILIQISTFCIILATKFVENKKKAMDVQTILREKISKNFSYDEIYVLKLLNYDLNLNTSYDILKDILYYGFIFENENINFKKLNLLYNNIINILYILSESNAYINMSPKQISLAIIGYCRELLGLNPFSEKIQSVFLITNMNLYISGMNTIKKKIKFDN